MAISWLRMRASVYTAEQPMVDLNDILAAREHSGGRPALLTPAPPRRTIAAAGSERTVMDSGREVARAPSVWRRVITAAIGLAVIGLAQARKRA